MEGQNIHESALKEINRILKSIGSDIVTIDFSKMDVVSAGMIRDGIKNILYSRKTGLNGIITGVNKY